MSWMLVLASAFADFVAAHIQDRAYLWAVKKLRSAMIPIIDEPLLDAFPIVRFASPGNLERCAINFEMFLTHSPTPNALSRKVRGTSSATAPLSCRQSGNYHE